MKKYNTSVDTDPACSTFPDYVGKVKHAPANIRNVFSVEASMPTVGFRTSFIPTANMS